MKDLLLLLFLIFCGAGIFGAMQCAPLLEGSVIAAGIFILAVLVLACAAQKELDDEFPL